MSLDTSIGAIELGVLMGTLLYGTNLVQTYLYATQHGSGDANWIKSLVGVVCTLETMHTMCAWAYLYFLTVTNFGNPVGLNGLPWYFDATIPLQALAGAAVQAFFSYRVLVLSGKWWLAAPAFIGQAFRAGLGLAVIVLTLQDKELSVFHAKHGYIVYATVITSAVTDLWNTVLLCLYLRRMQSSYASTTNAIHSIMLWSIETGIFTTTLAMLIVIFWGTMPSNGLWVCVNMIYPKLYPNSLLVSLNSRTKLRAEPTSVMITRTVDLSGPSAQNPRTETVVDSENIGGVALEDLVTKGDHTYTEYTVSERSRSLVEV